MNIDEYCGFFDIDRAGVDIEAMTAPETISRLERDKYVILHDVVDPAIVREMREFWLTAPLRPVMHADLCYGQENYAHDFFGKYRRYFDFYWNAPTCKLSRRVSLLLHFARNTATRLHPMYGLSFMPGRIGIYQAVTHYPLETGEMAVHVDPNYFLPTHYILPLTFKGRDWLHGGLRVHLESEILDIDARLSPGSVLIFYPSLPHSVERIRGAGPETGNGRLQLFSIPTEFTQTEPKPAYRNLAWELFGRGKYALYKRGIGLKPSHKNFR